MAEPNSRPIGVTIVAWLFIVSGVTSATAVLLWFALSGRFSEGLPLEVIAGVAAAIFLGVVAGAKLLGGKSWAWYEVTSLCVLALMLAAATASADVINVPGDRPTIQAAIDIAVNGAVVIVAEGE